jgi:hypothetical protein
LVRPASPVPDLNNAFPGLGANRPGARPQKGFPGLRGRPTRGQTSKRLSLASGPASRVRRALSAVHPRSRSLSEPLPQQPPAPSVIMHGRSQHCMCMQVIWSDRLCVCSVDDSQSYAKSRLDRPRPSSADPGPDLEKAFPGLGAGRPGARPQKGSPGLRGRPARGQTSKRLSRASGQAGPEPDLKKALPGFGAINVLLINLAPVGARFYWFNFQKKIDLAPVGARIYWFSCK